MRLCLDLESYLEKLLECNSRSFLIQSSLQPFRFIAIALIKFHLFMFQKTIAKIEDLLSLFSIRTFMSASIGAQT